MGHKKRKGKTSCSAACTFHNGDFIFSLDNSSQSFCMQNDNKLSEILVLKELGLFNLNMQMIPLELEIRGTPMDQGKRLHKLESDLDKIRIEFVQLYDKLWETCQSNGFYVHTTKSFAFGVLYKIEFEIKPIPEDGKYPEEYVILPNKT